MPDGREHVRQQRIPRQFFPGIKLHDPLALPVGNNGDRNSTDEPTLSGCCSPIIPDERLDILAPLDLHALPGSPRQSFSRGKLNGCIIL